MFLFVKICLAAIGVCVFCALTSVGALFYFTEEVKMKRNNIIALLVCLCMLICVGIGYNISEKQNKNGAVPTVSDTIQTPQSDSDLLNSGVSAEGSETVNTYYLKSGFSVHFIDVGQGDSALVICDGKTMLIDGGKPHASSIIYTYLKKLGIEYLDYIVASHADDDHIGGLSAPLSKMKVGSVLAPETEANTSSYTNFKTKATEQGLTIRHPKPGDTLTLGSSKTTFLGPITESGSDRNNGSIVMKVVYGETSFLFTGDAEREEEQQILSTGCDLSATVLKVGHHGSRNSTTYPFLREIMPKYAVISVGKDNSYGHPTEDTLSRLRDADVKVYRTDMQGDIIAVSDGKTVTITTKKNKDAVTNPTESEKSDNKNGSNSADTYQSGNTAADNTEYDYIGNKNSMKFHYPECTAAGKMKETNKVYLHCTREKAIADGYTPCEQCNP